MMENRVKKGDLTSPGASKAATCLLKKQKRAKMVMKQGRGYH